MNELIQQARELCEKAKTEKIKGNTIDCAALSWAIVQNIVPQLCDALEAAQKEIERLNKSTETLGNMINQYADKARNAIDQQEHDRAFYEKSVSEYNARAEKAEAYVEMFLDEEETVMPPDPFRKED